MEAANATMDLAKTSKRSTVFLAKIGSLRLRKGIGDQIWSTGPRMPQRRRQNRVGSTFRRICLLDGEKLRVATFNDNLANNERFFAKIATSTRIATTKRYPFTNLDYGAANPPTGKTSKSTERNSAGFLI